MAVCRGGLGFWIGLGRSPSCRLQCLSLAQPHDLHRALSRATRNISSALAPAKCHGNVCQPTLESALWVKQERLGLVNGEETENLWLLLGPWDGEGRHTLVVARVRLDELLDCRSVLLLPLTAVDGRREDDINVMAGSCHRDSFQSLFETERCPAPFVCGSRFYCFHGSPLPTLRAARLPWPHASDCRTMEVQRGEAGQSSGEQEGEEKLALMYERLRVELPNFFAKKHDYSLYSADVEFIHEMLNIKTRGRLAYQALLTLWQLLCRLHMAEVQLQVLKLTKHSDDGTVRARWRVRGQPFYLMPLRFLRRDRAPLYRTYDAFSTFYLGPEGLVHRHRVDKVMKAQPPALPRVPSILASALVALGVQEHRPALNLLPFLLSSLRPGRP